jgi:putative FmdB family regulatory protein
MPTYEFKCTHCGERFDLKLGFFHSKKAEKCPKCGTEGAERVFSSFGTSSSSSGSCSTKGFG